MCNDFNEIQTGLFDLSLKIQEVKSKVVIILIIRRYQECKPIVGW
jgi:hypothetical protein